MRQEQGGLTKNQILTMLTASVHGTFSESEYTHRKETINKNTKLKAPERTKKLVALEQMRTAAVEFCDVAKRAAEQEPSFLAHLIAYDRTRGQIRDTKVVLPVLSLVPGFPEELAENSLAHLALLSPREFLRAYQFARESRVAGRMRIRRLVERYLRNIESNWDRWTRTAVLHRKSLKDLYWAERVPCSPTVSAILWGSVKRDGHQEPRAYPGGSVFAEIAQLKNMSVQEAAGVILDRKIPIQVVLAALEKKAKEPDVVLAMLEQITPTQLTNNTKMLERLGVKTVPALRAAYQAALDRAGSSKKATFKASVAADAIEDEVLEAKLRALQENQVKQLAKIDGNWLLLVDRSPSMELCIEVGRHIATMLTARVQGTVHLIFFDQSPLYVNATGLTYDMLRKGTAHIGVGAGTSIGCGMQYALDNKLDIDGIGIISDAQENLMPAFAERYKRYCEVTKKEPTVYLYRFQPGMRALHDRDLAVTMKAAGLDMQEFDLRRGVDYNSLPNIVATMRVNRYSLLDEVEATKLLTLDDVLKPLVKEVKHVKFRETQSV